MKQWTNTMKIRSGRHSRGQALVLGTLILTVLIGFVGLAADAGYFFDYRRRMTAAADSAAVAGALEAKRNSSSTQVVTVARTAAAASGFTDGTNGINVTVNRPPVSGYNVGNNKFVEVLINRPSPTFFMRALNVATATVGARAVAGPGGVGDGCIYVLNPSSSSTLKLSTSSGLNMPNCGVIVNSSANPAMSTSGTACLHASSISITGNWTSASSCPPTPTPSINIPPAADPLSDLQAPTWSDCTGSSTKLDLKDAKPHTLNPGVYCGGIVISASTPVTFNPGLYILQGVGLSSVDSALSGTGVTFYIDAGKLSITGGSAQFSAPTSGQWESILFFQKRGMTAKAVFPQGGTLSFEGVFYFPDAEVNFSGGTTNTAAYTMIVSAMLEIKDGSTIGANFAGLAHGNPIKKVTLSE